MSREHMTEFETDTGAEVIVTFAWSPGTPESGAYNCPPENYDPGSAPELEILHIRPLVDDKPGVEDVMLSDEDRQRFHDENVDVDWDEDDRARGDEYRAEQRRDDRLMGFDA